MTIYLIIIFTADFNNNLKVSGNTLLIIIPIFSGTILILLILLTLCAIKKICVKKKTSEEDPKQQPIYDDIAQYHEEIQMEGNAAYGNVVHTSKN
jgi:hypothetical protein